MKYKEIKDKRKDTINNLFNDLGVFWAFSNEQFDQGRAKYPLKDGEKYASIGAGGYIINTNVDKLVQGMKEIEKTFKKEIKQAKVRKEHILYELNNHEAFYTGDIESTLNALGSDYTHAEVVEVYKEYKKAKYKQNLSIDELKEIYV